MDVVDHEHPARDEFVAGGTRRARAVVKASRPSAFDSAHVQGPGEDRGEWLSFAGEDSLRGMKYSESTYFNARNETHKYLQMGSVSVFVCDGAVG